MLSVHSVQIAIFLPALLLAFRLISIGFCLFLPHTILQYAIYEYANKLNKIKNITNQKTECKRREKCLSTSYKSEFVQIITGTEVYARTAQHSVTTQHRIPLHFHFYDISLLWNCGSKEITLRPFRCYCVYGCVHCASMWIYWCELYFLFSIHQKVILS